MSYQIKKTDGTFLVELADETANAFTTSLTLVGRAYKKWGEAFNNDLVHLLENAAAPLAPTSPLTGQLWFDTTTARLRVYQGGLPWTALATENWAKLTFVTLGTGPGQSLNPVEIGWSIDNSGLRGAVGSTDLGLFAFQDYVRSYANTVAAQDCAAERAWVIQQGYQQGNQTITLGGDASGSGTTSISVTLSPTGVTPGTYTSVVVGSDGRVRAGSQGQYLSGNQQITLSGDVSGSGTTQIAVALAATGVGAGNYSKVQVDTKGRVLSGAQIAFADVVNALGFTPVQQGTGGVQGGNLIKIGYANDGSGKTRLTVDNSDFGNIALEGWVGGNYVNKGGDTMTGQLNAPVLNATSNVYSTGALLSRQQSNGGYLAQHSAATLISEFSAGSSGYQRFPNGFIIQTFGGALPSGGANYFAFPVPFPNACFCCVGTIGAMGDPQAALQVAPVDKGSVYARLTNSGGGSNGLNFVAFGY